MATKPKKATPETCRNTTTGAIQCPLCRANCVPMASGKGFRCSKGKVSKVRGQWVTEGCQGVIWQKTTFAVREEIPRAANWPTISKPTTEQKTLRTLMSQTPNQRGGRCVITDAGPGTAKTTTISWGAAELYRRLGNLKGFPMLTFNVNAKNVATGKLPAEFPDVATLNGWHAGAQGYKFSQYDTKKLSTLFKELTDHLPKEERPKLGIVGKIVERLRDVCLFNPDESDKGWWMDAVSAVLRRFPGLARKVEQQPKGMELIQDYLPALAVRSHGIKTKIDLQEQVSRPVWEAIARTGFKMRMDCVCKPAAEWTDGDVSHFAKLIRTVQLPSVPGMIVDEAQDLSLCQIATILAQVWNRGELFIIGDDKDGEPGELGYKAGQAIYGWRGAFGGSLNLIARLWHELTGETAIRASLTTTFRHGPEICAAYNPLNTVIQSGLPAGRSQAFKVNPGQAFAAWIALPEDKTALWITRTNAPLSGILIDTLKAQQECCIRGAADFMGTVDGAIYSAAGWYDAAGEYSVNLPTALAKLSELAAEAEGQANGAPDPSSVERFILELGTAIQAEPALLAKAGLEERATVGNLRRFIAFYANKSARRVLTTVYRCKGDEADLAIVGDAAKFNETWGDESEDAACRHVALSRAKSTLLTVGYIVGSDMETAPLEMFAD